MNIFQIEWMGNVRDVVVISILQDIVIIVWNTFRITKITSNVHVAERTRCIIIRGYVFHVAL